MSSIQEMRAQRGARNKLMDGRRYFEERERGLDIADLPADEVQDRPPAENLETGSAVSRVGGRIAHRDLKRLSPEETAERRERSESFLTQPPKRFPAEEARSIAPPSAASQRTKKQ
jgi:hypothetical protein